MIQLAACGVSANPSGTLVAAGDLLGFIRISETEIANLRTSYTTQIHTLEGIRSLCWFNDDILLVGGMGGKLASFNTSSEKFENLRENEQKLDGSITTIRVFKSRVMCSSISGRVYMFT